MAYATVDELAAEMTISSPTAAQTASMQRALDAAAEEIDWWLEYTVPPDPVPTLVRQVNLDRAHEHFDQPRTPFGMFAVGAEEVVSTASNGWRRHALKLMPLKRHRGVA